MKLADLRRLSVRKNVRVRFRLRNGMECVVTERGIAQVPGLTRAPDFNLEEELTAASEFTLEPAEANKKDLSTHRIGREELAGLAAPASAAAGSGHEEEE